MKNRLLLWWMIIGILGTILFGLIFFYFNFKKIIVKTNKFENIIEIKPTATPTPDPLAAYSILLLGYGGGTHEGGLLTDSIIVAKIDPRAEEIILVSIPRDLWVPIPINGDRTENKKINEAYAIGMSDKKYPNKKIEFTGKAGGGEMAKYVIGNVVGFKIDYFVTIDFDGFVKIIDILGGIDVKFTKVFDDPKYPIETNINDSCGKTDEEVKSLTATMSGEKLEDQFMCRYENLHFEIGTTKMDGITALKYARSRHSITEGGDFNRAERQKKVILAIKDKIINIDFISKIIPTIQTLTKNILTDINFTKMSYFVSKIPEISKYKVVSVALTDKNVLIDTKATTGQFILSPKLGENNWVEIQEFIKNKGIATSSAIKFQN